jgi:hypothetical protein
MSTLARQQQAMLAALFDWRPEDAMQNIAAYTTDTRARGLKAYKSNGHALAQRALQAAFPVLAQLLSAESFDALARAYWHAEPPTCGDVAEWGVGLPAFVRRSAQLQDEPYLADVAALEWALHRAASVADAEVDAASFALLASHEPEALQLRLAPGCAVMVSAWPVASIWAAHIDQRVSFDELRQRFQAGTPEFAAVWRSALRTQVQQITCAEHTLLGALLSGRSFGEALDAVSTQDTTNGAAHPWDASSWLANAVQGGLLLGVQVCPPYQ